MKNKELISALTGSAFFALPYLGLSIAFAPSLVIGCAAFGASELILSDFKPKEKLKDYNRPLYLKVTTARKQNKEIESYISKIEDSEIQKDLKEINITVEKIICTIEEKSDKENRLNNFFDYYLPVLLNIVKRYDEIENQGLVGKDGSAFMSKVGKMIKDTKGAFKSILSSLYQGDIIDADAEMKVYDVMLKADGILGDDLMKGSDDDEE